MKKKKLKKNAYSFVLGVTIGSTILLGARKINFGNKIGIQFNMDSKNILLDDDVKLNKYLGDKVSFSDVINTITNNKNLSESDKNKIIDVVRKLEKKAPFIDLRCFNCNCKNLKIIRQKIEIKNVSGIFNSHDDSIILESENNKVFNHEILHLLNSLYMEIDGKRIIKNYNCNTENLSHQTEAFTEWLNSYIFEYSVSSYKKEISNLNIIRKILNISDSDLIKIFINKNYKVFLSLLDVDNRSFKRINEILETSENSRTNLKNEQVEEIADVYIDTYIKVNGSQVNDRLYQFIDCLCKNYILNCDSSYENQIAFRNKVIKKVSEKFKIKKPIIYDYFDGQEEYLNLDNLYLVCSNDESGNKSYFLAEKYMDDNNEVLMTNLQKIYLNSKVYDCDCRETPYRLSVNLIGEEDQVYIYDYIPVKNLLCSDVETNINKLITNYENYKQQSKSKKYKKC